MSENGDDSNAQKCTVRLGELKKLRGSLKGRLTLFEKFIKRIKKSSLDKALLAEIALRIETATTLLDSYTETQNEIDLLSDESEFSTNLEYRENFESQFFNYMADAKCLLNEESEDSSNCSLPHHLQTNNFSRLPEVKLAVFDGSFDNWLEFRNSYMTMIHKRSDLDAIQKFHYLKSSLSGSALQVISALEFTASNYNHAWDLIHSRYHNNRLLRHNHVKSLFTAPSVNKESSMLIRRLIDSIRRNLRALKSLGEPTDTWDTLVIYLTVSKLDSATERDWENHNGSLTVSASKEKPCLEDLLTFLKNKADMLDMVNSGQYNRSTQSSKPISDSKKHNSQNIQSFVSTGNSNNSQREKRTRSCALCGANHVIYTCFRFLNLSIQDRLKFVNDKNLCSNCLRTGHKTTECNFGPCKQCNKKHNSLLHYEKAKSETSDSIVARAHYSLPARVGASDERMTAANAASPASHSTTHIPINSNQCLFANEVHNKSGHFSLQKVLLCTALIEVADVNNKYHTARALLDSGSQNCFITLKMRQKLNVPMIQSTTRITGVGQTISQSTQLCDIHMRSKINTYNTRIQCLVLPCITSNVPSSGVDVSSLCIPNNINLADPSFHVPSEIDILIGADKFWDLLCDDRIRLPSGPYLQGSRLGWLLSGPICTRNLRINNNQVQCNFTQTLDTQLRKFWELEEIETRDNILTKDDRICETLFTNTTKRLSDGRFSVRIPMRESPEVLGHSYDTAKKRLLSLEHKLERSPQYNSMYRDFMRQYNDLGHMSPLDTVDVNKPHYFIPHHAVFKEQSTTTKLRVVFDASSPTASGKSLNDIQLIGPPLQNDIFSILLRFRQYLYVACADVEKMYRQIAVQEDQRPLQLILWRDSTSEPIGIFQLNTVTYGTASAPYLSIRCLHQIANECRDSGDNVTATVIRHDFFVDDLITGDDNAEVLIHICETTFQALQKACFPLRKWTFNFDVTTEVSKELSIGEHCQSKTLGLGWYNKSDELHFTTAVNITSPLTKRTMLSVVSQIYDPLGLLAPMIIIAKLLLQRLWLQRIEWDDIVPNEVKVSWDRFLDGLSYLQQLHIPRHVIGEHAQYKELHIFTDSSQEAYGACAYVKTYSDNSPVTIRLLCAKSKVAPIKTVTIPRLELCGALIGAKLYKKVINSLRLKFDKVYFWTDSTIVMGWLRISPHLLKSFVQNRVIQINDLTGDSVWLHVNTKDNPADLVSRGLNLNELVNCSLWWDGPLFLREQNLQFHKTYDTDCTSLPEVKSNTICTLSNPPECTFDFNRFSSYRRMVRTGAYKRRFIANCRTKCKTDRQTGSLSVDELNASTLMLARLAQLHSFAGERDCLQTNKLVKSNKISGLNVFMDENKLLRVGGRLSNSSDFAYNKKHPILLCSKHRFTVLLFRYEHVQLLHAGPQLLLSSIRELWWPLGARNLARKTVRECVTCVRMKGKSYEMIMSNIKSERLQPGSVFMYCGQDYAGPVMYLNRKGRGATLIKGYVCLFICLCTRAIHLELVSSLSTHDYILALKRFISRRGKPAVIFSDNGKTFVGADRELSSFLNTNNEAIKDYAVNNSIQFKFIPPYSPHFGGLWESGVKSCKFHMRRVIGNANLTYEELSTVLAQIEAVLNSRPMYPMSTDPNDLLPLCPAHFLIGRPLTAPVTSEDLTAVSTPRLIRYERVEQMRQHFWKRWSKEYISELQMRTKWKANKDTLVPDTLVLIKEDNLPPLKWRLGRILQTYVGRDGISRVADVKTATGIVRRSYPKLCPLLPEDHNQGAATSTCG